MEQAHTSARQIAARKREVARRYRKKKRFSIAGLRVRELNRLFTARYGPVLPDDDAARADARIMAHHLVSAAGKDDDVVWVETWLAEHAPWLSQAEGAELILETERRPKRWKADELGKELSLSATERHDLKIRTIGACDMNKRQRTMTRRARARYRAMLRRRAQGSKPRAAYAWAGRTEPWRDLGISRATYYRRCAADLAQAAE